MSWLLRLLVLLAVGSPSAAHAFSDPALFARPALQGGGDGRFFTGSPLDGYTCASCHRGGTQPALSLYGLPEVLDPGKEYQITLRWAQPELAHALQLELLTEHGNTPEVSLTPAEQLSSLQRCESAPDGEPAVYAVELPRRRVLGVRDCGAGELTFRLVAPDAQRVYLTASLVRSDSQGTYDGDGVLDLTRTLYRRGDVPEEGGCAVHARPGGGTIACLWLALVMLAGRARAPRALLLGTLSLGALGCYQPEQSADLPAIDAAQPPSADPPSESMLDASVRTGGPALMVRVRTAAFGGKYAPRNIGAIWIERSDGGYVKTLERWAGTRAMYLRNWQRASLGDVTDAITGATLDAHQTHEVTWDFTDVAGMPVPDGAYRVGLELTDRDATGAVTYVPFSKGPDGMLSAMPTATAQFSELTVTLR